MRMRSWLFHFRAKETANQTSHQSKLENFPECVYIFLEFANSIHSSSGLAVHLSRHSIPTINLTWKAVWMTGTLRKEGRERPAGTWAKPETSETMKGSFQRYLHTPPILLVGARQLELKVTLSAHLSPNKEEKLSGGPHCGWSYLWREIKTGWPWWTT